MTPDSQCLDPIFVVPAKAGTPLLVKRNARKNKRDPRIRGGDVEGETAAYLNRFGDSPQRVPSARRKVEEARDRAVPAALPVAIAVGIGARFAAGLARFGAGAFGAARFLAR